MLYFHFQRKFYIPLFLKEATTMTNPLKNVKSLKNKRSMVCQENCSPVAKCVYSRKIKRKKF